MFQHGRKRMMLCSFCHGVHDVWTHTWGCGVLKDSWGSPPAHQELFCLADTRPALFLHSREVKVCASAATFFTIVHDVFLLQKILP